uniref:Uncharacterized protein n=1 Tax=Octopus bimaculoides TaxID=37653 RepID=A0A0L8GA40_OCTBM
MSSYIIKLAELLVSGRRPCNILYMQMYIRTCFLLFLNEIKKNCCMSLLMGY